MLYFCNLKILKAGALKVYRSIEDVAIESGSVVSTGTFDGIHKGHRVIIQRMRQLSVENQLNSIVVTFEPHPRIALNKDVGQLKLLSTLEEKIFIFESLGIDALLVIPFTGAFATTSYQDYISHVLVTKLKAQKIVLGFNHQFGEARSGNYNTLLELGGMYGYEVCEVEPQFVDGQTVSSTKIRGLIQQQKIEQANALLGYAYQLSGKVVHGKKRGRALGFPTANLQIENSYKLIPALGVYAVRVFIDNIEYQGMCSVGLNPTFSDNVQTTEVHIFNFDRDIYGQSLTLTFEKFLRPEVKYSHTEELIQQLNADQTASLKFFSNQ